MRLFMRNQFMSNVYVTRGDVFAIKVLFFWPCRTYVRTYVILFILYSIVYQVYRIAIVFGVSIGIPSIIWLK